MPTKELVITLSRLLMLFTALIVLFLAAMITHRPVVAQNGNGSMESRVTRQEYQLESQQQSLSRIETKLQKMEDQLNQQSMAFTELKTVVYTGAGLLAFLLAGQLVVSLRKKP